MKRMKKTQTKTKKIYMNIKEEGNHENQYQTTSYMIVIYRLPDSLKLDRRKLRRYII